MLSVLAAVIFLPMLLQIREGWVYYKWVINKRRVTRTVAEHISEST